jgi:hypothetical protein
LLRFFLLVLLCAALLFQGLCPPACSQVTGPQPQPGSASGGVTTPILSTIEDILIYIAVSWLL